MTVNLSGYSVFEFGFFSKKYALCKKGDPFCGEQTPLQTFLEETSDKNSRFFGAKIDRSVTLYIPEEQVKAVFKKIDQQQVIKPSANNGDAITNAML